MLVGGCALCTLFPRHGADIVRIPLLLCFSQLFFALLRCPVDLELKGELMCALASLVDGSDAALRVWVELERSQVLQTAPHVGGARVRASGIKQELTQNFSYPLMCGFMRLLNALVSHRVPVQLGQGFRNPGIDPYLAFVIDFVFLRKSVMHGGGGGGSRGGVDAMDDSHSRSVGASFGGGSSRSGGSVSGSGERGERWESMALALEFFNVFVESYEVFADPRAPGAPVVPLPTEFTTGASNAGTSVAAMCGGRPETDFVALQHAYVGGLCGVCVVSALMCVRCVSERL